VLLKQGGTLGDEGSALFRSFLVRRTDDLDRSYPPTMPLGVIHPHLVLVLLRQLWSPCPSKNARRTERVTHWCQRVRDASANWARAIANVYELGTYKYCA
jgi:hypothetical protein